MPTQSRSREEQTKVIGPMFDYATTAQELHIPSHIVRKLEAQVRAEFPDDSMLMELHMLRAVKATAAQLRKDIIETENLS